MRGVLRATRFGLKRLRDKTRDKIPFFWCSWDCLYATSSAVPFLRVIIKEINRTGQTHLSKPKFFVLLLYEAVQPPAVSVSDCWLKQWLNGFRRQVNTNRITLMNDHSLIPSGLLSSELMAQRLGIHVKSLLAMRRSAITPFKEGRDYRWSGLVQGGRLQWKPDATEKAFEVFQRLPAEEIETFGACSKLAARA